MSEVFIAPETLNAWMASGNTLVFDCRHQLTDPPAGEQAYRAGHIPGAFFANVDRDLSAIHADNREGGRHPLPEKTAFVETLRLWGVRHDHRVVVYDDMGGAFAARLWWMLGWVGHAHAFILNGGIQAWERAGLALNRDMPNALAASDFQATAERLSTFSVDEVVANLTAPSVQLLDARDKPRYLGEVEPFGPVAGHIPGAWSVPFKGAMQSDGTLLPSEQLDARFAALKGHDDLVSYCGSGVTGAFNIAAMVQAGLPAPRLYIGSWSEWSARTELPVAKGEEPTQPIDW